MPETNFIQTLSVEQFRRFGIACCYRLGCDQKDKRLRKALKLLERSLGPPVDEEMRRDALNAARSVHREFYSSNNTSEAIACTLVCACLDDPNPNLIGNFELALGASEQLTRAQIREIENEILRTVLNEEQS
jgi:hypothetical protein